MDKPDVKESIQAIVQKMGFLKNYTSLIAPVSICIAGIIVLVLNHMMVGKLSEQITKDSVRVGDSIERLLQTAVSKDQWKEEQKYQTAYRRDANEIVALVNQSTQRPLLSYKLFPYPKDKSSLIFEEFGKEFRSGIGIILDKLNAGDCPTNDELARHLQGTGAGRGVVSFSESYNPSTEVDAAIRDVLCLDKAKSASVYVNPLIISGYDFWRAYQNPGVDDAIVDSWYWQLGYWIIEDVLKTVGNLNHGAANVFASPVKRVMNIGFYGTESSDSYSEEGSSVVSDGIRPSYVLADVAAVADAAGGGWGKETCTGRYCNENIDVVHFKLSVLLDTRQVADFMKELCSAKEHSFRGFSGMEPAKTFRHNQITILKYASSPINREDPLHVLYRYGEDAVVQLDLLCEYILVKSGYDAIKPESIKTQLNPVTTESFEY